MTLKWEPTRRSQIRRSQSTKRRAKERRWLFYGQQLAFTLNQKIQPEFDLLPLILAALILINLDRRLTCYKEAQNQRDRFVITLWSQNKLSLRMLLREWHQNSNTRTRKREACFESWADFDWNDEKVGAEQVVAHNKTYFLSLIFS